MAEDIYRITSPDDPERCQSVMAHGQCLNKAEPGYTYCKLHASNVQKQNEQAQRLSNYRLAMWQSRLDEKANNPEVKNLRDEIGILRMIAEEKLRQCQSTTDLILQSGPISDIVTKIEKLVVSCHRLESSMGNLLDKTALVQFASEVIKVISDIVTDQAQVLLIASGISNLLERTHAQNSSSD